MTVFHNDHGAANWSVLHALSGADEATMSTMRAALASGKGKLQGTEARVPFESIIERVASPQGVVYEADHVGGVPGWWCRPEGARPDQVVMHIHGGWFNWGSARAYRNLAGQIAASAGVAAFVPDYRLAPEHPFPAAIEDVRACYVGLVERGFSRIAITGDSAGGNLALGLLIYLAGEPGCCQQSSRRWSSTFACHGSIVFGEKAGQRVPRPIPSLPSRKRPD
jgi:monoterpene epsilon-lactone hydrolase